MGLNRTVEPATTPITVAELKKQLELPSSDSYHDTHLTRIIEAATRAAERFTKRAFITQTWEMKLQAFPSWEIVIPRPPLQSISSIEYVDTDGDTQTVSSSNYLVSTSSLPGKVTPAYGEVWPSARWQMDAVTVTFVAGYGAASTDVVQDIRHALLIWCDQMFHDGIGCPMPEATRTLLDSVHPGVLHGTWQV